MATPTERQSTSSQSMRPGIHKNCGSLRRRGILKAATKSVTFDRSTNPLWKRNGSVLVSPNPPYTLSELSVSFSIADEEETPPMGLGKPDGEFRHESDCAASPDTSCLMQPQSLYQQGVRELRRQGAWTLLGNYPVLFEGFTAPQMQRIFRTAYRITRNREDAEDAVQDACLQAIAHLHDFDGRSKFSTWLTRIVINSSLMILRKQRNARTISVDSATDSEKSNAFQEVSDPAPGAEKSYLQKERDTTLRNEINALRPNLRCVIELAHLCEWSIRETAEMLGLSVGAVKARLFHARRTLRNSRRLRTFRNDHPANQHGPCKRAW
jgi:RNA polymerase sigma factor (sigma-70 family)